MPQEKEFDHTLQVRITKDQLAAYQRAARRDGRTLSNWVRMRLDDAAKRELKKPSESG